MQFNKFKIADLLPSQYNPRKELKPNDAEFEKLKNSICEFGYVEPILVNKRNNTVIGGHQRLSVMKYLGYDTVDCVVIDLDEQKEKALNIALNKISGEWDESKLADLLKELDLQGYKTTVTGFDTAEIEELLNRFYSKEAVQDNFDETQALNEIKEKGTITKNGDIWKLGRHLLLCGDSTKEEDVTRILQGETAQLCVTSPPYGVGKEYETKGIEPWFALIKPVIRNITKYAKTICWNLSDLYITGTQFIEPTMTYSTNMFIEHGFRLIWTRIWKKQGMNFGVSPYHLVTNKPVQQYEYISAYSNTAEPEYNEAGKPADINIQEYEWVSAFAGHSYKFVKRLTKEERRKWGYAGIWEINTVRANKEHPAMFPVELPWRCIKMHSDECGVVLEPFCGSGTAIIACEQTGRCCRAIEKSAEYCDVAVKRWEEFTGKKAELLKGGLYAD